MLNLKEITLSIVAAIPVIAAATPLRAAQQDIAIIENLPCDTIFRFNTEVIGHAGPGAAENFFVATQIIPDEFGIPEANAVLSRIASCANLEANTHRKGEFRLLTMNMKTVFNDPRDFFGIRRAEKRRAENLQKKQDAASKVAFNARLKERQDEEVSAIRAKIHQLSPSNDLVETYQEINELQNSISKLSLETRSDLLDELQIAQAPVDRKRIQVTSDLQHELASIQPLRDDATKLHRLSDLSARIKAVPGSDAEKIAQNVEIFRAATREKIRSAASATDAMTSVENEKITSEATIQKDSTENALLAENVYLPNMVGIYEIAKQCANHNLVYDDSKVAALKLKITNFIGANNIAKPRVDAVWNTVQMKMATTALTENDCVSVGSNIRAVFGQDVFKDTIEKNPF